VIDGMNAVDACYYFAGVVGISPERWTLKRLWQMANARIEQARRESVQLAGLVWGMGAMDIEAFIHFGEWVSFDKNRPVEFSEEQERNIQAEIERIRRENPGLPGAKSR